MGDNKSNIQLSPDFQLFNYKFDIKDDSLGIQSSLEYLQYISLVSLLDNQLKAKFVGITILMLLLLTIYIFYNSKCNTFL